MTKIQVKHNGVMQKVTQSVHFIQCKVNKKTVCMQSNTFPTQGYIYLLSTAFFQPVYHFFKLQSSDFHFLLQLIHKRLIL